MCKYMEKSLGKKVTLDFQNVLSISIPQLVLLLLHFIASGLCTGNRAHVGSVLCSLPWSNNKCCWSKDSYFVGLPKRECKWKTGGKKSQCCSKTFLSYSNTWTWVFFLKLPYQLEMLSASHKIPGNRKSSESAPFQAQTYFHSWQGEFCHQFKSGLLDYDPKPSAITDSSSLLVFINTVTKPH